MQSRVLGLKGLVTVEVITPEGEVIYTGTQSNTLVKEAPKILLGNILPYLAGVSNNRSFSNTPNDGRPVISPGEGGPDSHRAVSYVALGYYEDGEANPGLAAVTPNDLTMQVSSDRVAHKVLTDYTLGQYSVSFIASFTVDAGTENRNYIEAALMCPALSDDGPMTFAAIPDPPTLNHLVMFAHQIHSPVQANEGNTIKYTWTISMQEPS